MKKYGLLIVSGIITIFIYRYFDNLASISCEGYSGIGTCWTPSVIAAMILGFLIIPLHGAFLGAFIVLDIKKTYFKEWNLFKYVIIPLVWVSFFLLGLYFLNTL